MLTHCSVQVKPAPALLPHAVDMDEELDEAADEQRNKMREKYLQPEDLAQYAIAGELLHANFARLLYFPALMSRPVTPRLF